MSVTYIDTTENYGYNFIAGEFVPTGSDEYYIRRAQAAKLLGTDETEPAWHALTAEQIARLEQNGNYSPNWADVLVSSQCNLDSIKNTRFYGLVRLGAIGGGMLRYHDFTVPEGIYNSCIISCDIGNHCAVHNCAYLSHYIIGNTVILSKIDEMDTTNHSKAGNGIIKQGEAESVRVWIEPLNEAGGRGVLPFYDMIPADAYMWTVFRDDAALMKAFFDITNNSYDSRRGFYGVVGHNTVIKSCHTIKDVNIGESAYIKGANKLKNLSIKSDEASAAQIGEGVELVNGIIGYGCHIFYGCKAVRFVMGNNSNLKYGARLIHSILGDNSTVSCCEVLNNLVFPSHEQHHNNSFLIASMIMGQSNMAAGATVGSNHNSRGNDGEIIAGRGFWPGLSSTLKHNSRFASFTLITKGNYPNELNIPLPFSMVIDNPKENRLEVMPAYYWMYNMYALERNAWKYRTRDTRVYKVQHIVTDYLAPDTAEEILGAMRLIEEWVGKAVLSERDVSGEARNKEASNKSNAAGNNPCNTLGKTENASGDKEASNGQRDLSCEAVAASLDKVRALGREYLTHKAQAVQKLTVVGENLERSKRGVYIIKSAEAYNAYRQMLVMYAVKTLLAYFEESGETFESFSCGKTAEQTNARLSWLNMGGQLVSKTDFTELRNAIVNGNCKTWVAVHAEYDRLWARYPLDNALCALGVLRFLYADETDAKRWQTAGKEARTIRLYMEEQVYKTKLKDYTNAFRGCTYRNQAEQNAVLGKVEDNSFIKTAKQDTAAFIALLDKYGIGK